ncbi:Uncharacterized protein Adt_02891 [Abeliophyllum distichum]|uniref:Uncharacterized protein n=1 Tax=Abeliophyllum distichum TaxID=126358 RepID=A0ABD1VZ33_9LAMI
MEFLLVDTHSAYHGVFSRPVLKDLEVVTSIHHLAMKFSTPGGVAKVRNNQTKAMACYINALQKVAKCKDTSSRVMILQKEPMDIDNEKAEGDMVLNEGIDPQDHRLRFNCLTSRRVGHIPSEPSDPSQMLHLGQKLKKE